MSDFKAFTLTVLFVANLWPDMGSMNLPLPKNFKMASSSKALPVSMTTGLFMILRVSGQTNSKGTFLLSISLSLYFVSQPPIPSIKLII